MILFNWFFEFYVWKVGSESFVISFYPQVLIHSKQMWSF